MSKNGWSEEITMIFNGFMVTAEYEFSAFMPGGNGKRGLKADPDIKESLVVLRATPKNYKNDKRVLAMCWERVRELQDEMSPFRDD